MKEAGASRRPHVVTSQRRDVELTNTIMNKQRCGNVATSARDLPSIIKSNKGSEFEGDQEAYELGHGIPEQQRYRFRRSAFDLYCFPFFGY